MGGVCLATVLCTAMVGVPRPGPLPLGVETDQAPFLSAPAAPEAKPPSAKGAADLAATPAVVVGKVPRAVPKVVSGVARLKPLRGAAKLTAKVRLGRLAAAPVRLVFHRRRC